MANKIEQEMSGSEQLESSEQSQLQSGIEPLPEENPQLEAELIAGFLAKRAASEKALIGRLRPFLRREIRRNYPRLWRSAEDLEQSALLRLCELRTSQAKSIRGSFAQLAVFIVDEAAHVKHRSLEWSEPPEDFDGGGQLASIPIENLAELFACGLDADEANVLILHATFMAGDGPPLHEALGVTRKRARRMLLRAQDALLTLTSGEAMPLDEECDD